MKSMPVWLRYTIWRIVLFVAPLAVLLVAQVEPWIAVLVAALFGFSASLIFLRRDRETIAADLYAARTRERPPVAEDDEVEDAAVEDAAVGAASARQSLGGAAAPRSEREGEPEPDADDERREAREL